MKLNLNFKLLSLNVRGIRSIEKRKAIFNLLIKSKSDIIFLQETYSTLEVERVWNETLKETETCSQVLTEFPLRVIDL